MSIMGLSEAAFDAPPRAESTLRIDVAHDLTAVADRWRAFERDAAHSPFQTYAWGRSWFETVGAKAGYSPAIVSVRAGADLLALMPLCVAPGTVRLVVPLGAGEADYHAPLLAQPLRTELSDPAAVMRAVLGALPRHDAVVLERMPETIAGVRNPLFDAAHEPYFENAHVADLPDDLDRFLRDRCGSKTLQTIRRRRRKLEKAVGELSLVVAETESQVDAFLTPLFTQKSAQYRETGAADLTADPDRRAFYRDLALAGIRGGNGHLSALCAGETVLAAHLGLVEAGAFIYLLPSYTRDAELRRSSPGEALLMELFGWCIDRGIGVFDFTYGDQAYKARWANRVQPLASFTHAATPLGGAYLSARRLSRQAKTLARANPHVWRAVTAARASGWLR